jgi:hypothetical protein
LTVSLGAGSPKPKPKPKPKPCAALEFGHDIRSSSDGGGMSIKIFISSVSSEFRSYRDLLRHDLTRCDVAVKVEEDFVDLGGDMLDLLDVSIAQCDAVVHLVGDMTGSTPDAREQAALLRKHPGLATDLPPVAVARATLARKALAQIETAEATMRLGDTHSAPRTTASKWPPSRPW